MVLKSFLVKDKLDTTVGEAGVGTAAFVNLPVQRSMNTAYSFAVLLHLLEFPPLPPYRRSEKGQSLRLYYFIMHDSSASKLFDQDARTSSTSFVFLSATDW